MILFFCRWDYQPDICKDYKETGFCGFGGKYKLYQIVYSFVNEINRFLKILNFAPGLFY